jgi:hypothetical protein
MVTTSTASLIALAAGSRVGICVIVRAGVGFVRRIRYRRMVDERLERLWCQMRFHRSLQ